MSSWVPDYKDVVFQKCTISLEIGNFEGLFYDGRINRDSIPKDKHYYWTRHDDDWDWTEPVTVSPNMIMVNFCGMFISDAPLPITNETEILNFETYD